MDCAQPIIVLVEDEPLIRMIAAEFLCDAGYQVIEAAHAAEAIAVLERQADSIRVLFTDVHMPGEMDGLALAHHARSHWPWIKVLVASGRARPAITELPEGSLFLEKPYSIGRVIDQVTALTDED